MSFSHACSGPDRGVVEAGGNGMRQLDIAVHILQHIRARALQHAREPCRKPRGMTACGQRFPACFDADQSHRLRLGMNASKMPSALLPPPTHATTASGSRPVSVWNCSRASRPITD